MDGDVKPRLVREAVGLFQDPEALNAAVSDLISAGVDRAELGILAQEGVLSGGDAATPADSRQAGDDPQVPRQAMIADTDIRQGRTLVTSMASAVAALAASGVVVLTGGAAAAALVAAIGAGAGVGAFGALLGKRAAAVQQEYLDSQLRAGGILLWAKISDSAQEPRVRAILARHGADDIHIHEIAAEAR